MASLSLSLVLLPLSTRPDGQMRQQLSRSCPDEKWADRGAVQVARMLLGGGGGGLDLISETSYSGQAVKSIPSGKRAKEQVQRVRHRWPDHPPRTKRLPPLSAMTDQTAGSSAVALQLTFLGCASVLGHHAPTR